VSRERPQIQPALLLQKLKESVEKTVYRNQITLQQLVEKHFAIVREVKGPVEESNAKGEQTTA